MSQSLDRREFVKSSTAASAAFAAGSYFVSESPAQESKSANSRISAVLMGANGRGGQLTQSFLAQTNTEIGYIADVDERVVDRMKVNIGKLQERKVEGVADFRRALDDKNIDVLFVAAPTIGTPRPPSSAAPPASTSIARSPPATTRAKAS